MIELADHRDWNAQSAPHRPCIECDHRGRKGPDAGCRWPDQAGSCRAGIAILMKTFDLVH